VGADDFSEIGEIAPKSLVACEESPITPMNVQECGARRAIPQFFQAFSRFRQHE